MTTPTASDSEKMPIIFDDHTDPTTIELQYFIDTRIGKNTCKARCEFCFLDREHINDFHQDVEQARQMIDKLRARGYKVVPIVSDSFAENGKYLRSGIFHNNDGWYMGNAAWSSGRPLLEDNYNEMLDLCVDNGIHTIIMTSHGTEDREREFKGLTQPSVVREAVRRIKGYTERTGWKFRIILTFTLSRRNNSAEDIRRYFDYCESLEVHVARFNQFADIRNTHPELRMSPDDVSRTYRTLREVYDGRTGQVQLSVSEDFGFWGIEVMNFPEGVGHCVAGERLFGVVYPYVYACPVNLTVVSGKLTEDGDIAWDEAAYQRLMRAKDHPEFGGCIGVAYPHSPEIQQMLEPAVMTPERMDLDPAPAALATPGLTWPGMPAARGSASYAVPVLGPALTPPEPTTVSQARPAEAQPELVQIRLGRTQSTTTRE